jgi:hypothetical protein
MNKNFPTPFLRRDNQVCLSKLTLATTSIEEAPRMTTPLSSGTFNLAVGRRLEDGDGLAAMTTHLAVVPQLAELPSPAEVDGPSTAYVLAARPAFEGLRHASMQMAGLLLLAATGGRTWQDHTMLDLATAAQAEASDTLRALSPPARGQHHHLHLLGADRAMGEAIRCARSELHLSAEAQRLIQRAVQAAIDHLRYAAGALPGFELVALSQSCCAQHAVPPSQKG